MRQRSPARVQGSRDPLTGAASFPGSSGVPELEEETASAGGLHPRQGLPTETHLHCLPSGWALLGDGCCFPAKTPTHWPCPPPACSPQTLGTPQRQMGPPGVRSPGTRTKIPPACPVLPGCALRQGLSRAQGWHFGDMRRTARPSLQRRVIPTRHSPSPRPVTRDKRPRPSGQLLAAVTTCRPRARCPTAVERAGVGRTAVWVQGHLAPPPPLPELLDLSWTPPPHPGIKCASAPSHHGAGGGDLWS